MSQSTRFAIYVLLFFALSLAAEGAILNLNVRDTEGRPAAGVMFQIFPGSVGVDDDVLPLELKGRRSDSGSFSGYATDAGGNLRLELEDGLYTLAGFSQKQHFVFVEEVSAPGSVVISAADAVPVPVSCRAADGSPIQAAEIFFRPTKQAIASVDVTDNSGSLTAYVSGGNYHVILHSQFGEGPHYLVLPYQAISAPNAKVDFHVAEIPTSKLYFDLPATAAAFGIATVEVLESTYTSEYTGTIESDFNYDTHYTDFYSLVDTKSPYTLSAGMSYDFSIGFVAVFGAGVIYAYEFWLDSYPVSSGVQRTGITDDASFTLQVRADRGASNPIYHPGEEVTLRYEFRDQRNNLLHRILSFGEARIVYPVATVWDADGVPIANNYDVPFAEEYNTEDFFELTFTLPLSAVLGEYRAEVTIEAGLYGRIAGDFHFSVRPASDVSPPWIKSLNIPSESEAGQDLVVSATIIDNVGLANNPELLISVAGASWTEITMSQTGDDLYQATVPASLLIPGELNWHITARDLAGNSIERSGVTNIVDTSPPIIEHELIATAELGRELLIQADVRDNVGVEEAVLVYVRAGEDVRPMMMSATGSIYSASIPESEVTFDGVSYYIQATDTVGNTSFAPARTNTPVFAHVTVEDTSAPIISHIPMSVGMANIPVNIEAIITDNSGIVEATLSYKSIDEQNYQSINMNSQRDTYFAEIPMEAVRPEGVQYHITASDGVDPRGNIRVSASPASGGHFIEVRSEPDGTLVQLEIAPSADQSAPMDVVAGESVRFTATGRGGSGEMLVVDVVWTAAGGMGHIDQDGLFLAAGRITGNSMCRIIATARYVGEQGAILQAETWVRISPGPPDRITLNPGSAMIEAGDSLRFFAAVRDEYSNPASAEVNWSIDGGDQIGTINKGIFSASKVDMGNVVAEVNGIRASSEVTIIHGMLRRIAVSPSSASVGEIVADRTMQFTAEGYDAFGNQISIAPVWSVRGGVGTISGDGLFRGGTAGSGEVLAIVGDVSATVDIQVVSGPLHFVTVNPYIAYLPLSTASHKSTQQFVADGQDIAGNPVPLRDILWTADEFTGDISSSGLFTATDLGLQIGNIVINGTIWAFGKSATGREIPGKGLIVIQKSPASQLSSIGVIVQGSSGAPGSIPIATGESVQFEAAGSDPEGQSLSIYPSWSVEGGIGDIDVNGLFTATKPGSGAIVATAGGFTGRARIQITPGSLKSIVIRPDLLVLPPGAQRSLTAVGYDPFENVVPLGNYDVHWSVMGPLAKIASDSDSCMIAAGDSGNGIVSVRVGDISGATNVFVSSASITPNGISEEIYRELPYYLDIEPELVDITIDSQLQFTARAVDVLGNVDESRGGLSWSVIGDVGEIDPSGHFKAGDRPGSGRIIVTDGQTFGTAIVTVSASVGSVQELLIMPSEVSLSSGTVQELTALVRTLDGELMPALPAWRIIGNIGAVDASGHFAAITAGEGEVEATVLGLSARCRVTVSAGVPAQIEIQPDSLSTGAGEQRKFSVVSRDEAGNLVDSSPEFQTLGNLGTIDDNGLFTARQAKAGSVLAFVSEGALFGTADVEISPGSLAEIEVVGSSAASEEVVWAGSSVRFSAVGRDGYGNIVPVSPVWEIDAPVDIGNISSNGMFIADKVGQGQVRAKAGGLVGSASIEVIPATPAFIQVKPALISMSSQDAGTRQFSYTFLDLRGNIVDPTGSVELSWSVTEGIGTIDQTGLFVNEVNLNEPRTGHVTTTAVIDRGSEQERTIRGRATVVVSPGVKPLADITITPGSAQVIKGDTQRFTAVGRDTDGVEMAIYPAWNVISDDGGLDVSKAISADGIFSATPEMQIGSDWRVLALVTNSEGQLIRGEARFSLTTGPLQSIEVVCIGDLCKDPIESGQQVEVEAVGYDQFRNQVEIAPEWNISSEIAAIEPVSGAKKRAVLTAGLAGSGEVRAEYEGKEGKVHIAVIPGNLADVMVSTDPAQSDESIGANEANPLIIKAGSDVHFVAFGRDSDVDVLDNPKPVNTIDASPIWSAVSSDGTVDLGSISPDGRFVGKEVGTGQITAEADSVIGSFYVRVVAGELASIRVSPSPVSVVSGTQKQFLSTGYDQHGNEISDYHPTWQITGNIGNIDGSGLFTPVSLAQGSPPVSGTVATSEGTVQGAASVTVVSALGQLSAISISVEPSTVQAGGKAVCILKGIDEQGNPIVEIPTPDEISVTPARLGTVEASGRPNEWDFRADRELSPNPDERTGLLTIKVTVEGKTLSTDAPITLIPGQLSKIVVEPAEASLPAGSMMTFEATGYDTWGNLRELSAPEWTVSGEVGDAVLDTERPQEVVFTAITAGQGQLIASSQGYEGRADLAILPGELETLVIRPEEVVIVAGSSHRFVAAGRDQYGNEIADLKLDWQLRGDVSIGSVAEDGIFSAMKMGNAKLIAAYRGAAGVINSDEASITVVPGAIDSADIVIRKDGEILRGPFILLSGVQYDLHVQGTDVMGNLVPRLEEVAWNVPEDTGLIEPSPEDTADAVFTALFPSRGQITVTVEGINANTDVEIIPHSQDVSSRSGATISGPFDASIEIPPGALRDDETISITLASSPGSVERARRIGYVYSFKPDGTIFETPVELTLTYSSAAASEIDDERLSLYSWDRFQEKWIRAGGEVDPHQKSVTATVNYLALFAIMQDDSSVQNEPTSDSLEILDIQLSPNTYFAPEINRLTIHYRIGGDPHQPVAVTVIIYDIMGRLVRELLHESPKYPGWNTDQWDGTDEAGETVKNGRYILLVTAEIDGDKVNKVKHLAVFK
ncbi:FlgD immunoglobulin-like domain containing protein [Candidatus Poribacteria bacterium]